MKKSTIKYLAILVIIIIIISFTGYNLETEPDNIETISQKQLYNNFTSKYSFLKYVNLTHGNSKSEYVIGYYYAHALYIIHGKCQVGTICIYKVGNKINFPLTGISIEIKNIKLTGVCFASISKCSNVYNINMIEVVSKQLFLCGSFYQPGNHTIHVSFDIVPVYNIWIYHFNVKEIPCSYNYTLQVTSSTQPNKIVAN